jgi:hypothetical protein
MLPITRVKQRANELAVRISLKLGDLGIRSIADIRHVSLELRTAIWEKFIKRTDPRVAKMQKDMAALFKRQFAEVMENIRKNPPPKPEEPKAAHGVEKKLTPEQQRFLDLWMFDEKKWREEFAEAAEPHVRGGIIAGADDLFGTLGVEQVFVTDAAVNKYIKAHVFKFADEIGQTSVDRLKASLLEGLENGEAVTDFMARVQNVMVNATEARARTIAQTEIIGAVNKGSIEGSKQSGVVWGTQWIGALDERIRDSHERLTIEGAAVALGEKFDIGLEYPGDPSGDPSETVNCLPEYVYVTSPNEIEKVMKREYKGELITITTGVGNVLTATPNHPVLTPDGWVPLKLLVKGGYVFGCSFAEKIPFCDPNIDNYPARINKIFDSLSSSGRSHWIRDGYMNFHGDGRTGDINIITPGGLLKNTWDAEFDKPIKHKSFTSAPGATITGLLIKFGTLIEFTERALLAAHGIMGFLGKALSLFWRRLSHANIHGFTAISGGYAIFNKSRSNAGSGKMKSLGKRFFGFSGNVAPEQIINIDRSITSCHVYNLQVKNGWYVTNNISQDSDNVKGIITHNCRCTTKPLTEGPNGEKPGE